MKKTKLFRIIATLLSCMLLVTAGLQAQRPVADPHTEKLMLSGTGSDQTVPWDFYCTAGQNSGKWTKIEVPSNWELQGFGGYNYGLDKDSLRLNEKGIYKHTFQLPASWKNRVVRIVFDGVMTDATVKVNGKLAGPTHQGAFYTFKYDISALLRYGKENELEVTVAKNSANASVNKAERKGDFWVFGGIFRPVYLEALPQTFINRVSVSAQANGDFKSLVHLSAAEKKQIDQDAIQVQAQLFDLKGKKIGKQLQGAITKEDNRPKELREKSGTAAVYAINSHYDTTKAGIGLWSPESPQRYRVRFQLVRDGKVIHEVRQKIGFRTVEVRPRNGIYVNGVKIKFKGVNHHSFWPSTGRTTNKKLSIEDVLLLKDMNMNSVRMSHYPPDDHFLDACDSLGLFVLDELTGWHQKYDTEVGSKLVGEMIVKDENHPSIIMWANGNEGGFNFDLDHLFADYDLQKRPLIHPWAIFGHMDTQHYINYDYGNGTHLHGHEIVFPTEFLHGLYDGGLGAGLGDYWAQIWANPLSAGGFLWVFADEAVVRTDKNDALDADGDHGPDGIVGPYHEKEGSYYAIKEIWSPVFIEHREITPQFDGRLRLENRYAFTNLNQLTYTWALMDGGTPLDDADGRLSKMAATVSGAKILDSGVVSGNTAAALDIAPREWGYLQLGAPKSASFEKADYMRLSITDHHGHQIMVKTFPIKSNQAKSKELLAELQGQVSAGNWQIEKPADHYLVKGGGNSTGIDAFSYQFNRTTGLLEKVTVDGQQVPFNHGPVLCDGKAVMTGMDLVENKDSVVLKARFGKKSDLQELSWVIYPDGILKMQIAYFPHQYDYDYLGVSFNFPEDQVKGINRMGAGPYRVWKNRMEGVYLGQWHNDYNNTITGENIPKMIYPEFKGYFANLYWMQLLTKNVPITVLCASEDVFLRLYTPESPKKPYNTAPDFPEGDISFMHAINPIGTKSQVAENMGPSGRKNMYYDYGKAKEYGKPLTLYFIFGDTAPAAK